VEGKERPEKLCNGPACLYLALPRLQKNVVDLLFWRETVVWGIGVDLASGRRRKVEERHQSLVGMRELIRSTGSRAETEGKNVFNEGEEGER